MKFILLLASLPIICAVIGHYYVKRQYHPSHWEDDPYSYFGKNYNEGGGNGFTTGLILALVIFLGSLFYGHITQVERVAKTYPVPIVSLNDGTGVKGEFRGNMFVMRGSVNDTQHFAYYRGNSQIGYILEKRDATMSTIWMDATPETSRVDITELVYECTPTWWFKMCPRPSPTFHHADFHIPPNSIQEDFTLDAQ